MDRREYLEKKRKEILERIEPICKAFGIDSYNYTIENNHEILRVRGVKIGCDANSVDAVVDELIGYIFVMIWCRHRSLGAFETQSKNRIMEYWIKED